MRLAFGCWITNVSRRKGSRLQRVLRIPADIRNLFCEFENDNLISGSRIGRSRILHYCVSMANLQQYDREETTDLMLRHSSNFRIYSSLTARSTSLAHSTGITFQGTE